MLKKCVGSKKKVACAHYPDIKNPKNMRHKPNFQKKNVVLQRCNCQEIEVIGARVPSSKNWRFQTFEPMLPNLGTRGSHLEELLVPKRSNQCFPILEPQVPSSKSWWFQILEPLRRNLRTTGCKLESWIFLALCGTDVDSETETLWFPCTCL